VANGCSDGARELGEPLAGSADVASVLVAISWPKPLWDAEKAARSRGLPAGLLETVEVEERAGRKVAVRVFQRSPRTPTDRVELLAVAPGEGRSLWLRTLPTEELVSRLAAFSRNEAAGPSLRSPIVLVCTDGRHDRCCAEHGRAVYEAFRAEVLRLGLTLSVAESSHLGGHRFAATALLLPGGEMHGRLRAPDVPSVLEAWRNGTVWVPRFRGRIGTPEPVQVAEVFLRGRHPRAGRIDLALAPSTDATALVRARLPDLEAPLQLDVRCRQRSFRVRGGCTDERPAERTRWVVMGSEVSVGRSTADAS
jgi:hypothetical protein